jgi:HAD superfamily hydrolase (TIGR01509 family)
MTRDGHGARRFEAVLFDFGSTLFGHPDGAGFVRATAAGMGVEVDLAEADALWNEIRAELAGQTARWGRSDVDAEVWRQRSETVFGLADRLVQGLGPAIDASMHDPWAWVPYADTEATLRALGAAGVRIGVVSNTGWDVSEPFQVRGLDGLVDAWVFSYELGVAKPDAQLFLTACEKLGVAPASTLMVGDDPMADAGAAAVGLTAVILPLVPPGAIRGLDAAVSLVLRGPR